MTTAGFKRNSESHYHVKSNHRIGREDSQISIGSNININRFFHNYHSQAHSQLSNKIQNGSTVVNASSNFHASDWLHHSFSTCGIGDSIPGIRINLSNASNEFYHDAFNGHCNLSGLVRNNGDNQADSKLSRHCKPDFSTKSSYFLNSKNLPTYPSALASELGNQSDYKFDNASIRPNSFLPSLFNNSLSPIKPNKRLAQSHKIKSFPENQPNSKSFKTQIPKCSPSTMESPQPKINNDFRTSTPLHNHPHERQRKILLKTPNPKTLAPPPRTNNNYRVVKNTNTHKAPPNVEIIKTEIDLEIDKLFPQGLFRGIRTRFGTIALYHYRRIVNTCFTVKKANMDKSYLFNCLNHNVIPKFLNIKVGDPNNTRQISSNSEFQRITLRNLIRGKTTSIKRLNKLRVLSTKILSKITGEKIFDILLKKVESLILPKIAQTLITHDKKFNKLMLTSKNINMEVNEKYITNLSSHVLSQDEIITLGNGLKFVLGPNKFNENTAFVELESAISSLEYSNDPDIDFQALGNSLYGDVTKFHTNFKNNKPPFNITSKQMTAIKRLAENTNIVVSKPDKGNGVVLMDKQDYIAKIKKILSDTSKFKKVKNDDPYRMVINLESKITADLKNLKNEHLLSEKKYWELRPSGSRPCILYGLPKVHKKEAPLRPILSAVNSPAHSLAQWLVPRLTPITVNDFTISNTLQFAKEVSDSDLYKHYLASFDVVSLFTNIPLDESIKIIMKANMSGKLTVEFDNDTLFKMLTHLTKDCSFIFNEELYTQIDGVAMGSPLGPALANLFMVDFEEKYVKNCTENFKPLFYKRYVDDMLLAFNNEKDSDLFLEYMNSKHKNIKFTADKEENNRIDFLDVTIHKFNDHIETSVFRKKTFTGLLTRYNSHLFDMYKENLIQCLLYRGFKICSTKTKFENEVIFLKDLFKKNLFPKEILEKGIKKFRSKIPIYREKEQNKVLALNKSFHQDDQAVIPESEQYRIINLPYLGKASMSLKRAIKRSFRLFSPNTKVRIVFSATQTIGNFFKFKDKVDPDLRSRVIYKFSCSACAADYVGSTKRHVRTRVAEHLGISAIKGIPVASSTVPPTGPTSSVRQHLFETGHKFTTENFEVIDSAKNHRKLLILEALHIKRTNPSLNSKLTPFKLNIFKKPFPKNEGILDNKDIKTDILDAIMDNFINNNARHQTKLNSSTLTSTYNHSTRTKNNPRTHLPSQPTRPLLQKSHPPKTTPPY